MKVYLKMDPLIMAGIALIIAWLILQWSEPLIKYLLLLILFVLVYDFIVNGDTSTAAFLTSFISKTVNKAVVILQNLSKTNSTEIINNLTNTTPILLLIRKK